MYKLLTLLLTASLSANIINLQSTDILGKVVFERDSIVIASGNGLEPFVNSTHLASRIEKHVTVLILCFNQDCVTDNIAKYKSMYRTNGISVIDIKDYNEITN